MKNKAYRLILNVLWMFTLVVVSCTTSISSETAAPTPTATIDIDVLRSNPGYMAGCLELNPDVYQSQVSYRGVFPGQTRESDVRQLLGEPLKINNLTDVSWEYDGFIVIFDGELATSIIVYNDEVLNESLEDAIGRYGCPNAIYALDVNEHPFGQYSRLLFVYHDIGLYFTIDKIPVEVRDKIGEISYFVPGALEDFLKNFDSMLIPNASKPLTWDDAVH